MTKSKLAAFILMTAGAASAQTIHVIAVMDTQDRTIGSGAQGNLQKLSTLMLDVGSLLSIPIRQTNLSGSGFNCESINKTVNALSVRESDIVVFYYSGHGFRTKEEKSVFPSFYCGSDVFLNGAPNLENISKQIENKKPKFIFAVADTCNVVISEPETPKAAFNFSGNTNQRTAAYKRLFLGYKGTLIMSSSTPSQYSWYLPDQGLFSSQLFKAIDDATSLGQTGRWEDIVKSASKVIEVNTITGPKVFQNPQFNIDKLNAPI